MLLFFECLEGQGIVAERILYVSKVCLVRDEDLSWYPYLVELLFKHNAILLLVLNPIKVTFLAERLVKLILNGALPEVGQPLVDEAVKIIT